MKHSLIAAALIGAASGGAAQHAHGVQAPRETGQAQFAALAEIVQELRAAPDTNWGAVNIAALRDHLVDMDNVTTKASVRRVVDALTARFDVRGDPATAGSIWRMVHAHSPMLQGSTGWDVTATRTTAGAMMTVRVQSAEEMQQVLALGFFGLLTLGAHHQMHHVMIAQGRPPH